MSLMSFWCILAGAITGNANDNRPPSSPQRPSILRKRENEGCVCFLNIILYGK